MKLQGDRKLECVWECWEITVSKGKFLAMYLMDPFMDLLLLKLIQSLVRFSIGYLLNFCGTLGFFNWLLVVLVVTS